MNNNNNGYKPSVLYKHTHTPLQNNMHVSKVHCRSVFGQGASGPPYYCAPLVCAPAVIGMLAMWWHNKPKTEKPDVITCASLFIHVTGTDDAQ